MTRAEAEKALGLVVDTYEPSCPKAVGYLSKDGEALLAVNDSPAEHWGNVRATNATEPTFATVCLRTRGTKGRGSRIGSLTMVLRLTQCGERSGRPLNAAPLLADLMRDVHFEAGIKKDAA